MFQNAIVHLDLDAFFASVEQLKNSQLKGKPLLIGGSSGRGVVASCSYEARKFGIRSAMPMKLALQRCPDAVVLKGDYDSYTKHSKVVTEIIKEAAPLFEKASIDEFYIDASGMDRYVGCWKWSKELRTRIIKEAGLPISLGLSVNKTISKMATNEAKPNGAQLVEAATEKAYIAPFSTRKIPGVGLKTFRKLAFMGVQKIKILRDIPPRLLQREFGKYGGTLWKRANAIDNTPIIPYTEQKTMSAERTFQVDTIDMVLLKSQLTKLVMQLAFDLRKRAKLTACITIKIRYTDFNTYTLQKRIPHTANDQILLQFSLQLFDKIYQKRQLLRLIGVKFSHLVAGHYQTRLFEDTETDMQLLQTMDKIRQRFGKGAVLRASALKA